MIKAITKYILYSVLVIIYSCAKIGSPTGGPKDETPPEIVASEPDNYATAFTGKKIEVKFNEFIQLKNIYKELLISPPLEERPLTRLKGKSLVIDLNNELRGCIGYIMPQKPLYQTVIDNAYNAAYNDPRFPQITKEEIKKIKIEISILSIPEKINYQSKDELLRILVPKKDGVIICNDSRSATFLPQVWKKLPEKEFFLKQLCLKAGINPDIWEYDKPEILIYKVYSFHE